MQTHTTGPTENSARNPAEPVASEPAGRPLLATTGMAESGHLRAFADALCAVDGSHASRSAVEQSSALIGVNGSLTLLAVTGITGSGAFRQAAISPSRAEQLLESAAAIARRAGVSATKTIDEREAVGQAILERSEQHDLLAIGAPAIGWLGGALNGSVADATMSGFQMPLLAARPLPYGEYGKLGFPGRVLVASDGTPGSDAVIELAAALCIAHEATLTFLHAVGVEGAERPAHVAHQIERLCSLLGHPPQTRIEAGTPRKMILALAAELKASLVVLGSRRAEGLRAIGGVSHRVVHEAPCSVLLVPPASA